MDHPICIFESPMYKVFQDESHVWLQRSSDINTYLTIVNIDTADGVEIIDNQKAMLQPLVFLEHPRDLLLLGLGGGAMVRFVDHYLPELHLTAIEIDPEIVAIAQTFFSLPHTGGRFQVVVADAAKFIRDDAAPCDFIVSNAFGEKNHMSDALHDAPFYEACHRTLRTDGVMTVNIFRPPVGWGRGYLGMLNRIFTEVYFIKLSAENYVMVLCKDRVSLRWPSILETAMRLDDRTSSADVDFAGFVRRLQAGLATQRATVRR